jgi:hypothetical protein
MSCAILAKKLLPWPPSSLDRDFTPMVTIILKFILGIIIH